MAVKAAKEPTLAERAEAARRIGLRLEGAQWEIQESLREARVGLRDLDLEDGLRKLLLAIHDEIERVKPLAARAPARPRSLSAR